MKDSGTTRHIEVHAFLILERVAGSKEFLLSVLLQAGGQFIGKGSLGAIAEGQQIALSLGWDRRRRRFVATSQTAGSAPILSFIPFASPRAADGIAPGEFSMEKFVGNSGHKRMEAHETIAKDPTPRTSVH